MLPLSRRAGVLACALPGLAPLPAMADSEIPRTLETVSVVASAPLPGLEIEREWLPVNVQSADARALAAGGADTLGEFLARTMTGVNSADVQGSPFQSDISYRGYRASSLLGTPQGISVYLDGVRVNEAFGDVVNWDMVPEAALRSVALMPGSNPLFGLNTLGGALALQTKSGASDAGFAADLSTAGLGHGMERGRADLGWGWRNEQGWHAFAAGTAFADGGWRAHSQGQLGNVFAKAGHAGGATQWDASVLVGRSKLRGNGLLPDRLLDDGGTTQPGLYQADRRSVYT